MIASKSLEQVCYHQLLLKCTAENFTKGISSKDSRYEKFRKGVSSKISVFWYESLGYAAAMMSFKTYYLNKREAG